MKSIADSVESTFTNLLRISQAVYLDPRLLSTPSTWCTAPDYRRIHGPHYFLILAIKEGRAWFTPLSSRAGACRVEIRSHERAGHPDWCRPPCFLVHEKQVWSAPIATLLAATHLDKSLHLLAGRPTRPNLVRRGAYERVFELVRRSAGAGLSSLTDGLIR